MDNHIIETRRLLLRHWNDSDAEDLYRYACDPDVGPAAGWQPHKDEEESLRVIRELFGGRETYAVCMKRDGKAIGSIGLFFPGQSNIPLKEGEVELGYWIGRPFWGQGLIPEAACALIRHSFLDLGVTRIWCAHYEGNDKSKRVIEKCGFSYEYTRYDQPVPLLNERRNDIVYSLKRHAREGFDR